MLSRRNIFGALPLVAMAAAPVAVHAVEINKAQADWDRLVAGMSTMHPGFAPCLERARADGWQAHEFSYAIGGSACKRPSVAFERRQEEPAVGRQGYVHRSVLIGSYQEGHDKIEPVGVKLVRAGEAW